MPFRLKLRRFFGRSHLAPVYKLLDDPASLQTGFERDYAHFFTRKEQWKLSHPNISPDQSYPLSEIVSNPQRVLVLSPHPDDEVIGCGGAILEYVAQGTSLTVVQITDGSSCVALAGSQPAVRKTARLNEARRVADYMNIHDLRLWALPDSEFIIDDTLVQKLHLLLNELIPDIVYLPFINDYHPDHIKVNRLLYRALLSGSTLKSLKICFYETWSLVPANAHLDITDRFEFKAEALSRYPTAMQGVDYIEFCARRDALHHWQRTGKYGFMENFLILGKNDFLDIMKDYPDTPT